MYNNISFMSNKPRNALLRRVYQFNFTQWQGEYGLCRYSKKDNNTFQPGKKGHKSRISSSSSRRLPLQASSWLLGNFYRYNKQQEMCLGFTLICYSNTSRYTKDDYVWLLFIIVSEIELSFVQSSILHLTRTAY
jgi:hypothetical protein